MGTEPQGRVRRHGRTAADVDAARGPLNAEPTDGKVGGGRGRAPSAAPVLVLALATLGVTWWWGATHARPAPPEAVVDSLQLAAYARALAEARLLAAADSDALGGGVEDVARGLELRSTDPAGAARRFADAARRAALGDWGSALEADARARTGDLEGAREALEALPADLRAAWGWRAEALALLESGDPAAGADTARAGLARARTAADSASARWLTARNLLRAGDTVGARSLLRDAARGPAGARATVEAVAALTALPGATDADRLALVQHRVGRGELDDAGRDLDRLAAAGAADSVVAAGALTLANGLAARGRLDDAERRAASAAPGATGARRAALELAAGRARMRLGRDGFVPFLERAVQAAPGTPSAQEALFILADLDEDAGRRDRARERFSRAADLDPSTEWGAEASMRHGLLALAAGDGEEAARRFDAYRAAHDTGWRAQQATYWAAMARQRSGDRAAALPLLEAARAGDPSGYYALRAADRSSPGGADPLDGLPEPPPDDPVERRLAAGALGRMEALERLGLLEAAALERLRAGDVLAGRPGGLHALAEALRDRGRIVDAARAGRDARRRLGRWDARLLRVVYPLPWGDAIDRAARERGIDPALVAALIRQESLFQPDAVSGAGAVGLMQIMPATARGLAQRSGLPAPGVDGLRDPEVNIRLGTLHLDDLLRARDGRVDQVLATYNAGAGRVARWRDLAPDSDPDLFLERIPFRETREYVRVVQENAALYRALYWNGAEPHSP